MPLALIEGIAPLRARVGAARANGASIGLVPTMGALHEGHRALIRQAREAAGFVVVSLFVNPLQFDRADDLEKYPRTLEADLETCRALGVDAVFAPPPPEMYPVPPACRIEVGPLAEHCCGRFRPGHFEGVATVVMKLFQIVQPDAAWFGEKDAQQLAVVRRLVADFNLPLRIVGVPTVREADGLALSSRNARLDAGERQLAPSLYAALRAAQAAIEEGLTDPAAARARAISRIPDDSRLRIEYLEFVEADTFQPVPRIEGPGIVAGALWVGSTRLIDNVRHG